MLVTVNPFLSGNVWMKNQCEKSVGFHLEPLCGFKGYFIILCKVSVIDFYEINNKLVLS